MANGGRECDENSGGWGFPLGFPRAKDKDLASPRNDAVFIVDYIDNNNITLKSAAAPVGFLSVAVAACRSCIANASPMTGSSSAPSPDPKWAPMAS